MSCFLRLVARLAGALALGGALSACGSTVDSLGDAGEPPPPDSDTLRPLSGPASYPNLLRDLSGKSDAEIAASLESAFQRLFHGDPTTAAIYFTVGDDMAYVQDILHGDVRSEGMGLGMLIAVQLDKREEFDKLWRFARASLEHDTGPNRGYFRSTCELDPCADPYGHQQLTMALLLAHGRWGSRSGALDYGSDALRLLGVMREKERENGGVVAGVTDMFDPTQNLVLDVPESASAGVTRPSNVMPGYYELWAQATGDARWSDAALRGRELLQAATHPETGLVPQRAGFDGRPVAGSDTFGPEAYRTLLNMATDHVWLAPGEPYPAEADRLLGFFVAQGIDVYGAVYTIDGSACVDCFRSTALVAMNGAMALASTRADRKAFVDAVWDSAPAEGSGRYYDGLLQLLSLLALSGQLRVY